MRNAYSSQPSRSRENPAASRVALLAPALPSRLMTAAPSLSISSPLVDAAMKSGELLPLPSALGADGFPAWAPSPWVARRGEPNSFAPRAEEPGNGLPGVAGLAHDARNLFSAIHLYCELLAIPGVLAPGLGHYAQDLRRVGETGARLIEALAQTRSSARETPLAISHPLPGIQDLASELYAIEGALRTLAGPDVRLEVECAPCAGELALDAEGLFRILFNLVANAAEAMRSGQAASLAGTQESGAVPLRDSRRHVLRITVQRGHGASFLGGRNPGRPQTVVLSVRDNGPGIAAGDLPYVFEPGFSTRFGRGRETGRQPGVYDQRRDKASDTAGSPRAGRGLGLSIVRQLAQAAGGAVRAVSSAGAGTRFDIELPILPRNAVQHLPALAAAKGNNTGGNRAGRKTIGTGVERRVQCFQQP